MRSSAWEARTNSLLSLKGLNFLPWYAPPTNRWLLSFVLRTGAQLIIQKEIDLLAARFADRHPAGAAAEEFPSAWRAAEIEPSQRFWPASTFWVGSGVGQEIF